MDRVRGQDMSRATAEADQHFLGHEAGLGAAVALETQPHATAWAAVPAPLANVLQIVDQGGIPASGEGGAHKVTQAGAKHH